MSGEEDGAVSLSPPTSPLRSPATSPTRSVSPAARSVSPPTSPLWQSPVASSDSSSPTAPANRGRKRAVCRTTIRRGKKKLNIVIEVGEDMEEVAEPLQLIMRMQPVVEMPPEEVPPDEIYDDSTSDQDVTDTDSDSLPSPSGESSCRSSDEHNESSDSSESDVESNFSGNTMLSLYPGSDMSSNQALLNVLKLYVEERWTKTSLDKTIKMVSKMLPRPHEFPSSGKVALKKLESLTSSCNEKEHLYCDDCLLLVETESELCNHYSGQSKFYSFPIDEQIRHMFEQRGLASIIDSYREHPSKKLGHICDITDGEEYQNVRNYLPNPYDLILLWNTDGVALSSSSKQDLWPVLCTVCEVPPRLRSSFVLVAGVYVGQKDPNMNVFLRPFKDLLTTLWNNGLTWVHPVSKQHFTSKVVAPVLCADAPAKSKVLQHSNHNSLYGCVVCEQRMKKVDNPDPGKNRLRRFVYQEAPARIRRGTRMEKFAKVAERRGESCIGVMGKTIISEIPFLNRALCSCAEYMHLVLLGVVRYLLLIIFEKRGPWFIGDKIGEINCFIMNDIKVPDFINRCPRKLKDIKYWKASELRGFLLYYSLPVFKDKLPPPYFQHWLLLVGAVYILLKDTISEDDICKVEVMLRLFVRDVGLLYGNNCYVYNMHNLIHVPLLVRRWGPLWATSAFIFESYNGYLGQHVHGTRHLAKELISNIKITQSVTVLVNIVNAPPTNDYHNFRSRQLNSVLLGAALHKDLLSDEELLAVNLCRHLGAYVLHGQAELKNVFYSSKLYDANKKRANSYVQFMSENERHRYGQIIAFIKSECAALFCLIRVLKIVQINLLFHHASRHIVLHILPVEVTNELIVLLFESLLTKVIKVGTCIALRPNSYEVNL